MQGDAVVTTDAAVSLQKAESLSSALVVMTTLPWALCVTLYAGLYITYPRDKARAQGGKMQAGDTASTKLDGTSTDEDKIGAVESGSAAYVQMKLMGAGRESGSGEAKLLAADGCKSGEPEGDSDTQPILQHGERHDALSSDIRH